MSPPPAAMKDESLEDGIRRVGPWFHNIELAPGIKTREVNGSPPNGGRSIFHMNDGRRSETLFLQI